MEESVRSDVLGKIRMKLEKNFYLNPDVVEVARNLLGKYLFTNNGGVISGGYITETEAYEGVTDKASHAYNNKHTKRTEIMFKEGGRTYVYLCYGIHALVNIVTNIEGVPHAVLIRGIYPVIGIESILERIKRSDLKSSYFKGPGKISKALGITLVHNNLDLQNDQIWIEDRGMNVLDKNIRVGPRVGIDYAEEDALLPYRFELLQ